jgi:adhesin/invasin
MLSCFRLGLVLTLAVAAVACERVPLLAPTESTIRVSADTTVLPPGGRTQITAAVAEQGGTPVQNGTLVRFSATFGRVEPADVETRGGVATTTFIAGSASGVAQIRATSGGASGTGEGEGATATNVVEIRVGGAAAAALIMSANPSRVPPGGGTTTIVAAVLDASGNRLPSIPVTFSTDNGSLSSSSAITDASGEARVTLTTSREATVKGTATVGSGGTGGTTGATGEIKVTVGTAPTLTLTLQNQTVAAGSPVQLTVLPAADARVVVDWGDGSTTDAGNIAGGTAGGRALIHTYQSAGVYTIIATATAEGATFTSSVTVNVTPRAPINVTVTPSAGPHDQCEAVTFTATPAPTATEPVSSYRWTIASNASNENETLTTTGNTITRAFQNPGRKTVSVVVTTPDGREGNGQTQIVVQEPTTPPGPRCS